MTDISHVGIAVENLEEAIKKFTDIFGYGPSETVEMDDMNLRVALFSKDNGSTGNVELLAPTDKPSSIKKYLEKNGSGLHHIAIVVDDIEKKLAELKEKGYRLIDEIPRVGAMGHKIAFVHPSSVNGILFELVQK
ncbi:MAG: methylmalonyl-CoA epimerase [Candidatus Zixiibacteriota bacterium]